MRWLASSMFLAEGCVNPKTTWLFRPKYLFWNWLGSNLRKFSICNESSEVFHQATCLHFQPKSLQILFLQVEVGQRQLDQLGPFRWSGPIWNYYLFGVEMAQPKNVGDEPGRSASTKKHCGTDFSLALSIWVCQCVTHVFRALFGQGLILHFGSIVGWKQHSGLILALSFVSTKLTISNALVLKWQV